MDFTSRELRAFHLVATHLSFAQAAEALFITSSGLSVSIKSGRACRRSQTANLLDTQIGLVEAEQGIAVIPPFGLPACRNRKVTMSELVEPLVTLEFYEISSRARKLPTEASEFSDFLKKYIAR